MPERPEPLTVTFGPPRALRIGDETVIDQPIMQFTGKCVNDDGTVTIVTFPKVEFFEIQTTHDTPPRIVFEIAETPYRVQTYERTEGTPIYDQLMEDWR